MRFVSYAQEFEDLVLYVVLKDVVGGVYIDVGANDPDVISVTKAFYERGWHGINIEPLTSMCELLEEERTRDITLCVGCGEKDGEMYLTGEGAGATFSDEVVQNNKMKGHKSLKKIMTLTDIYKQYCQDKQAIHFCKIDVEGYEKNVLQGVDFDILRPWIYVIESTEPGTGIPSYDKWENILLDNGYLFAYKAGINRYYVDSRKEYLINRFEQIDEFKKNNEILKIDISQAKQNVVLRERIKRHAGYWKLMDKWMTLKEQGVTMSDMLHEKGINTIIVYGLGMLGKHLIYDLKEGGLQVVCGIDQTGEGDYAFPVYTLESCSQQADAVIVAVSYDHERIRGRLADKGYENVIFIEDLLNSGIGGELKSRGE